MDKITTLINIGSPKKTSIIKVENMNKETSIFVIFFLFKIVQKAMLINEKINMSLKAILKFP